MDKFWALPANYLKQRGFTAQRASGQRAFDLTILQNLLGLLLVWWLPGLRPVTRTGRKVAKTANVREWRYFSCLPWGLLEQLPVLVEPHQMHLFAPCPWRCLPVGELEQLP